MYRIKDNVLNSENDVFQYQIDKHFINNYMYIHVNVIIDF